MFSVSVSTQSDYRRPIYGTTRIHFSIYVVFTATDRNIQIFIQVYNYNDRDENIVWDFLDEQKLISSTKFYKNLNILQKFQNFDLL